MTHRQQEILKVMSDEGFIWYVDGAPGIGYNKQCWQYPALCHGKTMQRVTRVMVSKLLAAGLIAFKNDGSSYGITDKGRVAIGKETKTEVPVLRHH